MNQKITYKGVSVSAYEWGRKLGIKGSTIAGRIERGWSVEKSLETKPDALFVCRHKTPGKSASRNDAEMYLNDCMIKDVPGRIFKLLPKAEEQDRAGSWIRANHPSIFEEFYLKDFILRYQSP